VVKTIALVATLIFGAAAMFIYDHYDLYDAEKGRLRGVNNHRELSILVLYVLLVLAAGVSLFFVVKN
jgi:hypothetical protein